MKQISILFIALTALIFSSCERHDGKLYFKQVCHVECEGKKYIDQCPLTHIFAPNVTPYIHEWEYGGIEFTSNLCEKREGSTVIRIQLYMPCDDTDNIVGRRFDFAYTESDSNTWWEYLNYCRENGLNVGSIYAPTIPLESGVVKTGWFIVDSKDKDSNTCSGTFELTTVDDITITGNFANVVLPKASQQ